ncbi:MAG: hypothetical protein KAI67_01670 [Candidatus Pacebacteria bacterium]|nr:hypothetical protein [Candidatus Paceibacterota bacterium]
MRSNENNGNLFKKRIDEIKERTVLYLKCFEETDFEMYKNQYLLHVEYWGGVLQRIR